MNLETFKTLLPRIWSAETSATPELWTPQNPSRGQNIVTSALAEEILGLTMRHCEARLPNGQSEDHYLNWGDSRAKKNGVDLTKAQFPLGTQFSALAVKNEGLRSTRTYALSSLDTLSRYAKLRDSFCAASREVPRRAPWLLVDLHHTIIDSTGLSANKPAGLIRGAGALLPLAVSQGYKVGVLASGDEVTSRFQLAALPFTDLITAVLVAPKISLAQVATFMQAHGVEPARSILVGQVVGDGRSNLRMRGLKLYQFGSVEADPTGIPVPQINRLQDALRR